MRVITNWAPRALVSLQDLPAKAQKDFDYIKSDDEYSPRLVQYRGAWYDVYDTQVIEKGDKQHPVGWAMRVHPDSPLAKFDSIISDSCFSGVLFKLVGDDEVICATLYE